MSKTTQEDRFRILAEKYGLTKEDFADISKGGRKIIHMKRSGVQKVEAGSGIQVQMELIWNDPDQGIFAIKATAKSADGEYTVFASATPANCKNPHPLETCEARARSRAVLSLAGFYQLGIFGSEENTED